ncbi:MAG: response regulator transcription factor [Nitrosopumilus sp.]|nr:response regulator transcription factor [Nitrosopumilus sp.]
MENKKDLVVDDEPDITFLCKLVLEDEEFAVDAYTDSLSAFSDY